MVTKKTNASGDASKQATLLDHSVLESLRDLAGGQHLDIITSYQSFAEKAVNDLEKAVAENNAAEVLAIAHSLKSSSLQLGATQLGELAREMETMGLDGDLGSAGKVMQQMLVVSQQIQVEFTDYVEKAKVAKD